MNLRRLSLLLATLVILGQTTNAALRPRDRTLSASRQFVVYAADPLIAAQVCGHAEQIKRSWLKLLALPDQWQDPVVIVFADEQSAPSLQTVLFENQLRYQIRCPAQTSAEELSYLLTEALCREFANRGLIQKDPVPKAGADVPCWLIVGLAENIAERHELLLPVISRSVEGGRPASLESVLTATSLPGHEAERQLFRAHAWLLVESVLLLPRGPKRIQELLTQAVPVFGVETGGELAKEKWWALQLARKTVMRVAQSLDAAATARQLEQFLQINITDPATGRSQPTRFDQLGRYSELPWFRAFCADKHQNLVGLRGRFHPFYHEASASYVEALDWLRQGETGRYRAAAKRAADQHRAADRQAKAFRDYLDRAERVHAPAAGDLLPGVRQAVEATEKARTNDAIREYLDRFD